MYTQVLKIEIDGCHPAFDGCHTPGIVEKIRDIADQIEKSSVQMRTYPFYYLDNDGSVIAKIDLMEDDNEDGNDEGVPSLEMRSQDEHLKAEFLSR